MTIGALTPGYDGATLRLVKIARVALRVAVVTAAASWLTVAWTFQYLFEIPMTYVARIGKACLAMGVYAFLLFIPVIGWVILGSMITRGGARHRPVSWAPRAHWPRWAKAVS